MRKECRVQQKVEAGLSFFHGNRILVNTPEFIVRYKIALLGQCLHCPLPAFIEAFDAAEVSGAIPELKVAPDF